MIHHQIPWQKYPYITILSQYTTTGMHNYEEIYVNFAVPLAFFLSIMCLLTCGDADKQVG